MENNANIVIDYYRSIGLNDKTIAGILGNMQAESSINPEREEVGGSGYGLVQWTPVSVLQNHCNILGLSPYNSGDVQLRVLIQELENVSGVEEWYTTRAFVSSYYNSGATTDMIGITPAQFLNNTMNWQPDKLAIMFMVGYERPSYDPYTNHYNLRKQYALQWYEYMGGIPTPTPTKNKNSIKWLMTRTRKISIKYMKIINNKKGEKSIEKRRNGTINNWYSRKAWERSVCFNC